MLIEMDIINQIDIGILYAVLFLLLIFLNSNIILSFLFFYMANRLISATEKFEGKIDDLRIRNKNIEFKSKYGSYILGLLSVLFLFGIAPLLFFALLYLLPTSPFLDVMFSIGILESNKIYDNITCLNDLNNLNLHNKFVLLATAAISFFSFLRNSRTLSRNISQNNICYKN